MVGSNVYDDYGASVSHILSVDGFWTMTSKALALSAYSGTPTDIWKDVVVMVTWEKVSEVTSIRSHWCPANSQKRLG